jgi:hypothetical protein
MGHFFRISTVNYVWAKKKWSLNGGDIYHSMDRTSGHCIEVVTRTCFTVLIRMVTYSKKYLGGGGDSANTYAKDSSS